MGAEKNSALPSSSKVGRYGQLPKPEAEGHGLLALLFSPKEPPSKLDFGQNLNGLAIDQGAKYGVHQSLYGHGQAETARKIAAVSTYPANALSPALSKLAKVAKVAKVKLRYTPV
ncbi:MAG: hypothetical protein WAL40_15760 [Rhodoplanes sp.]